jgi:hypothetical protein
MELKEAGLARANAKINFRNGGYAEGFSGKARRQGNPCRA